MLLNSKNSNFIFNFPKGWFFDDVYNRYKIFLERNPLMFTNLTDYMSYTVQSVSWPSFSGETVEQIKKTKVKTFKGGFDFQRQVEKEIRVTFKTVEGFLNYFVMYDQLEQYWKLRTDGETFLPDLHIYVLDQAGMLLITRYFTNVVFSGMSELELSFASNVPEYRTFDCTFKYTDIITKRHLD